MTSPSLNYPTGWVLLDQKVASNSASINFTNVITSAYSQYCVIGYNIQPTTNGFYLCMRTSSNNGVSYDVGASDYTYAYRVQDNAAFALANILNNNLIDLGGVLSNAGFRPDDLILYFFNPSTAGFNKQFQYSQFGVRAGSWTNFWGGALRKSTAIVNAIQFFMNSGNLATGTFSLYGLEP